MNSLTAALADFVVSSDAADIPDDVRVAATRAMIDTLGCALAGVGEPASVIAAHSVADAPTGAGASLLWGSACYAGIGDAAFVNAISTHALDFDDNIPSQRGHPSATVLPAALAAAEAVGASGTELLDAYAIGVEISGKIGPTVGFGHYVRGWHSTATIGIFGATAAVARLLGLDSLQTAYAWGLAASQTSGLVANFGTMAKPFNAGHAARNAVTACLLARDGFTANPAIFDGPNSVLVTYGGEGAVALDTHTARLAAPWEIIDPGIFVKRWPCCYCSHRPLSALFALVAQHELKAEEIECVEVGFAPGTDGGLREGIPDSGLAGKFSVEYTLAAAILDGKVSMGSFTDDMVLRPTAQELLKRVRRYRIPDERRWSSAVGYNDVRIVTTRGTFSTRVELTPGSPAAPLSEQELDEKFLDCAGSTLGPIRARRSLQHIKAMAKAADCKGLIAALAT